MCIRGECECVFVFSGCVVRSCGGGWWADIVRTLCVRGHRDVFVCCASASGFAELVCAIVAQLRMCACMGGCC